ncbi:hypothetical protein M011DRAFT_459649 [Sporormia fimetaria CBS 119925]|uniref:Uncharacterized protein n=1 Tax=Sporormia fimetaria CBS 119925 TaxID=1340428 RepID=A0A6A6V8U2_9PLEO|nr:hypothetical protein M011DRAFT_459649 [Sporormia fimetaria CBS 119925]
MQCEAGARSRAGNWSAVGFVREGQQRAWDNATLQKTATQELKLGLFVTFRIHSLPGVAPNWFLGHTSSPSHGSSTPSRRGPPDDVGAMAAAAVLHQHPMNPSPRGFHRPQGAHPDINSPTLPPEREPYTALHPDLQKQGTSQTDKDANF